MKKLWQEPEMEIMLLNGADVLADSPDEIDDVEWDDWE